MDAIEFLKEKDRMCSSFKNDCVKCPLFNCEDIKSYEETVAIVAKWSKEHSIISNGHKFIELFGDDKLNDIIYNYIQFSKIPEFSKWLTDEYKEPVIEKDEDQEDDEE